MLQAGMGSIWVPKPFGCTYVHTSLDGCQGCHPAALHICSGSCSSVTKAAAEALCHCLHKEANESFQYIGTFEGPADWLHLIFKLHVA